jgi:hypothetical protein
MIRHGRNKHGQLNSTLVTLREGDTIYFGIAKCKLGNDGDVFSKKEGRERAYDRALIALKSACRNPIVQDGIVMHKSGLLGRCHVEDVKRLLGYFREAGVYLSI